MDLGIASMRGSFTPSALPPGRRRLRSRVLASLRALHTSARSTFSSYRALISLALFKTPIFLLLDLFVLFIHLSSTALDQWQERQTVSPVACTSLFDSEWSESGWFPGVSSCKFEFLKRGSRVSESCFCGFLACGVAIRECLLRPPCHILPPSRIGWGCFGLFL